MARRSCTSGGHREWLGLLCVPCISPRTPHSCPPLAVAAVSRLAKRPRSSLALTRRTRPRQSCSEEDGTGQSGAWPVGSGFTDDAACPPLAAVDLLRRLFLQIADRSPSRGYPAASPAVTLGRDAAQRSAWDRPGPAAASCGELPRGKRCRAFPAPPLAPAPEDEPGLPAGRDQRRARSAGSAGVMARMSSENQAARHSGIRLDPAAGSTKPFAVRKR